MNAVVFDLFGTLVTAPTRDERMQAADRLARALGCDTTVAQDYLNNTWQVRHDGTLSTVTELAAHMATRLGKYPACVAEPLEEELRALGSARLIPDTPVVEVMQSLRSKGLRIGVLSDASPEVAAAWPASPLAALTDVAVFSCRAGGIKPDALLYQRICKGLRVSAWRILYVGDGGGNELHGALSAGMTAVAVRRRGAVDALAFEETPWAGPRIDAVDQVPTYLEQLS